MTLEELGLGTTWPGQTLFDFKWVQTNQVSVKDTPGMVAARKLMKDKPGDYYALLTKLEEEYWAKEQAQGPAAGEKLTEKDELMEGLLREEWGKVKRVV